MSNAYSLKELSGSQRILAAHWPLRHVETYCHVVLQGVSWDCIRGHAGMDALRARLFEGGDGRTRLK